MSGHRLKAFAGAVVGLVVMGWLTVGPACAQERRITVMVWGSTWNGILKDLSAQFTRETGIGVDVVVQASAQEGLVKLQAMRERPTIDVWFSNESIAQRAATDPGLLAPMPVDQLSNWSDVIPEAKTPSFVAAYYYPVGIVYRPDLVPGGKITSWEELWNPVHANRLALPVPAIHPARMLLIATILAGGGIDDLEPGYKKLQLLKNNVAFWYASDPQARRALAQGEVSIMITSPSAIKTLADQGVPVEMVSPRPAPLAFEGPTIVRGSQEVMAAKFVNRVISPEWQKVITEIWNMGPVNRKVAPGERFAAVMPKSGDSVVFDESVINRRIGAWTEEFNHRIAR